MKLKIIALSVVLLFLTCAAPAQNAPSRIAPLTAGAVAPDFSLSDQNGRIVKLSAVGKTTVLVFYRGHWCPFCVRQLAELRGLLKDGEDAALFAISVDAPGKSRNLAEKIAKDGKGALGFPLLSDPGHKTIDAYGLVDPAYAGESVEGIPRPAVYILDKNRKIVWAKIESDYKKRPTLAEIRAELEKSK